MPDWSQHVRPRLSGLRLSPTREAEIVEELSQHLDDRWRELMARGLEPDEAARMARTEFSGARLTAAGARGRHGYYEALDYTKSRVPEGETMAPVRAYMAHHQGMTVVALLNVLRDGLMRQRFHAVRSVQANDLLLQERTPRDFSVTRPRADEVRAAYAGAAPCSETIR